jgi:hypothetical protein
VRFLESNPGPLFQRSAFRLIRCRGETALALLAGVDQPIPVRLRAGHMLWSCSSFASLEEHARRLSEEFILGRARPSDVAAVLMEAVESGLLVSDRQLAAAARPSERADDQVPIHSVGILTNGRREALRRCLTSYGDHLDRFGRTARLTIVDSAASSCGDETEPSLKASRGWSGRLRWFGPRRKAAFVRRLAKAAGVDHRVVEFALCDADGAGTDVGANRNMLMLAHAGETFLSSDDDMICTPRTRMTRSNRIVLDDGDLPMPVTLHPDFASARDSLVPVENCALDHHERLLGLGVNGLLAQEGAQTTLRSLSPMLVASLLRGRTQIVASFAGYYGDAGSRYPGFYLWSGMDVRDQLMHGYEDYRARVSSRQIVRLPPDATISSSRFSMCGTVALDCRNLLPPFFPVMRGEDLAFGAVLRTCFVDSVFAYVPVAIAHVPWHARGTEERLWDPARRVPMSVILGELIEFVGAGAQVATAGERRMRLLGRCLQELARLPPSDLQEQIRERIAQAIARSIAAADRLVQQANGTPEYWVSDLQRFIDHQTALLGEPMLALPSELAHRNADAAAAVLRSWLEKYGLLLEGWPEVFSAATYLRDEE